MNKRFMNRKAGKVLAAAAAVVGFAAVATPRADATMTIDLRAAGVVAGTGTVSADGKTVTVSPGAVVQVNVIGVMTGTNGNQIVANFDNKDKPAFPPVFPANDTRNDEALQFVVGAFNTSGPLKGNYDASFSQPAGPFLGNGAHGAVAADYDGDGSIDLGYDVTSTNTDPTNLWAARANSPLGATQFINSSHPGGTNGLSGVPTSPSVDFTGTTGLVEDGNPLDKIVDTNTSEVLIGSVFWTATTGDGQSLLEFHPRTNGDAQVLWYQDGSSNALTSLSAPTQFSVSPVTVQTVPEPASLGLLGVLGAGLISRRRRKA